ncbi:hypothetical protein [Marinobacter sp. C2H3]|uniref:hypothetical protein n=1 Tax=Marinobacter sp. C2H3 TaxID=3119003 RepID=UPI00300E7EEC
MEDWQGCLAPEGQKALVSAREQVERRGGTVVTAEDFLLSLLDAAPELHRFLSARGVDLDELTRTIQCEQPMVTEVTADGALSSQLTDWLALAREVYGLPWLGWPHLLDTLVHRAERLQGKAYVAVLELVGDWPVRASDTVAPSDPGSRSNGVSPVVAVDRDWMALAEDAAVTLSAGRNALLWVGGDRGCGLSSWLETLLPMLARDAVHLDLRRETEWMDSHTPAVPVADGPGGERLSGDEAPWPVLVLDGQGPEDLLALMAQPWSGSRELLLRWRGPLLLLGAGAPDGETEGRLGAILGRSLEYARLPACSESQRLAVLACHQSRIEKRWSVELSAPALRYAASRRSSTVATPGGMLHWVERAAARLDLYARQGPGEALALRDRAETLRRQALVAHARQQPVAPLEQALADLAIERSAADVGWHERKRVGTLRCLMVDDLKRELERWLAARPGPVHYVRANEQPRGATAGAGSGNLHS